MDGEWYFAYGSNLAPIIFLERRGMHPRETRVGRLDGYRLCFDLPIGSGERAVANVEAEPGAHVWGALYLLEQQEAEHLDRTEGVPNGIYQRRIVEVIDSTGQPVRAFTYESSLRQEGRKPSARYLGLILTGAQVHGLPAAYRDWLQSIELAHDERAGTANEI